MFNLDLMGARLMYQGGIKQEDRMIKDKHRTFLKTLRYSYQGCDVQKYTSYTSCEPLEKQPIFRALINPNKIKQDYDDKILSADDRIGFCAGDIFKWIGTNSYWLITLGELTEDAYFRSEIRRCRHIIKFKDKEGNVHETWAAIRGPVETQINSIQKNQVRIDQTNWSLNILIPRNEVTYSVFDRYTEFLFEDRCWRVQVVNSISMENILEIAAEEYYINRDTDDVENSLKNGLVIEEVIPDNEDIAGNTFIKPKITEKFEATEPDGSWIAYGDDGIKVPVEITTAEDGLICYVTWQKTISGQFNLEWISSDGIQKLTKKVVVESLF